jgi:putative MATE family efflux protein
MSEAKLISGRVERHLLNLSLPTMIGLICQFSFILADTYFISLLGQYNLTAFSYTMPVVDFIVALGLGIGIATSSIVARRIGAGEIAMVRQYTFHALLLAIALFIIIGSTGIATIHPLFIALGANDDAIHLIFDFMIIWYASVALIFMMFITSFSLRAAGHVKGPSMILIACAIINFILDPIFIFAFHLGIAGAAIASLITRLIGFALLLRLLIKHQLVTLSFQQFSLTEMLNSWKKVTSLGIPVCITNVMPTITSAWTIYLLAKIDQTAVAGFGVAQKVQMLAVIPLFALSGAISPIVGQNFAAKKLDRAYDALKKSCLFAIAWGILVAIILFFTARPISRLFSNNPTIISVSSDFLYIVPMSYTAWGTLMMINSSFNSLGHPVRATFISFCRLILIFIPLSLFMLHQFGYQGIFWSFSLSTFTMAIIGFLWIRKFLGRL